MRLITKLNIGIFNVFLFVFIYMLLSTIVAYFSSKAGFKRGSDRSWIKKEDKLSVYLSEFIFLAFIIFSIFVPVESGTNTFYIGLIVYIVAFLLSLYTNYCYVTAPLGKLITKGIYKYSRNPAYVCNSLLILSAFLLSEAYIFLVFFFLFLVSTYFTIQVEEKYCTEKYGIEYKAYLAKTPRYFLFF